MFGVKTQKVFIKQIKRNIMPIFYALVLLEILIDFAHIPPK